MLPIIIITIIKSLQPRRLRIPSGGSLLRSAQHHRPRNASKEPAGGHGPLPACSSRGCVPTPPALPCRLPGRDLPAPAAAATRRGPSRPTAQAGWGGSRNNSGPDPRPGGDWGPRSCASGAPPHATPGSRPPASPRRPPGPAAVAAESAFGCASAASRAGGGAGS